MTRKYLASYRDARLDTPLSNATNEQHLDEIFAKVGLTPYEANMLIETGLGKNATARQLSRTVYTGTDGLQHTWQALQRKGLVRWRRHLFDRQHQSLATTKRGERVLEQLEDLLEQHHEAQRADLYRV